MLASNRLPELMFLTTLTGRTLEEDGLGVRPPVEPEEPEEPECVRRGVCSCLLPVMVGRCR